MEMPVSRGPRQHSPGITVQWLGLPGMQRAVSGVNHPCFDCFKKQRELSIFYVANSNKTKKLNVKCKSKVPT